MELVIRIKADGAAFEEDPAAEIRRILERAGTGVQGLLVVRKDGGFRSVSIPLRDTNGNTVGVAKVSQCKR